MPMHLAWAMLPRPRRLRPFAALGFAAVAKAAPRMPAGGDGRAHELVPHHSPVREGAAVFRARWRAAGVRVGVRPVGIGIGRVHADGQPRPGGQLRGHERSVGDQCQYRYDRVHDGPRRPRRARAAHGLSAGGGHRHHSGRLRRRHGLQRLCHGVHRSPEPAARHHASGDGGRDVDPGLVHVRRRRGPGRVDHCHLGRRRGPERRVRLPGQRGALAGRGSAGQADRRSAGVTRVLGGLRRVRTRRRRQVRRDGDGQYHRRHRRRQRRQRPVFAQAAVTMDTDQFYSAPPTVTLTGGAAEDINNSTPTISGSTNVGASGVVTVTVAGQTLTATPADDGSWSVTPKILANATYTVLASTTDGAGNVGTATQQLTIDTVPPLITLTGPVLTNNPTATISGTTDAAAGTIIDVDVEAQTLTAVVNGTTIVESVGAQTLTALVQSTGTWNITPAPMGEGTRTVTAAVTDLAGNTSTATEQLTVDTVPPLITLTGPVLTNNPTPTISGTTDAPSGAVVTVNLADETRPGSVRRNVV